MPPLPTILSLHLLWLQLCVIASCHWVCHPDKVLLGPTCLLKGQVFHEMKSLNWLILLTIYLVWLSYSFCFIFDYNYSSFALRLQTSQHLILDLLYLKQWKAAKVRAKSINQNMEIFIGNTGPFNRLVVQLELQPTSTPTDQEDERTNMRGMVVT